MNPIQHSVLIQHLLGGLWWFGLVRCYAAHPFGTRKTP